MARPSLGQAKKVTPENLVGLGAERLAAILADVATTRVDLKRRLRMELAAQQGPGPLTAEIDRRLQAFETSRGQIGWRQRPAFIRDLDALRDLIVARLAPLDASAAVDRLWRFMDAAPQSQRRYRERNGELEAVFAHAAGDLGGLLATAPVGPTAATLVESLSANSGGWSAWLPAFLRAASPALAAEALAVVAERRAAGRGWITLIRHLADAAGDVDAFRATFTAEAARAPPAAAELAERFLAAGRVDAAGEILRAAAPAEPKKGRSPVVDFGWESQWIMYLDRAGRSEEAQSVRWASFARTLSPERARAFLAPLPDFEDVEAETRAFALAAEYQDAAAGLAFLMDWPALSEAAAMIERRRAGLDLDAETAELWAAKLRRRFPKAAHALLRTAASAAFRRREFQTCDRLSAEAETLEV